MKTQAKGKHPDITVQTAVHPDTAGWNLFCSYEQAFTYRNQTAEA